MKKTFKILAGLALATAMIFTSCSYTGEDTTELVPDVTGFVNGDTTTAFGGLKISDAYCGTYDGTADEPATVKNDAGQVVLNVENGIIELGFFSWDNFVIDLGKTVDLSEAKKLKIAVYVKDYTPGDAIVFEVADKDKNAVGINSWTDATLFKDLSDTVKEYVVDLSTLSDQAGNGKFAGAAADYDASKVQYFGINPRGAAGQFYIKSITVVTE
ncbi:MAG: hypothetical protein K5866_02090 [Treponema sp.]|nr:hypothetical protein [Treponema sp.]